jgi:ppGpp synthetase/RelA/SpoT-type nucleotidyltranferase
MKLDMHCEMILDEYREKLPLFEKLRSIAMERIEHCLNENKIVVASINSRIKTEESLTGKLELKGYKYRTLDDITDIVGIRVVTFFSDEVDVISALAEQLFEIDWENTVDKRKMMEIDRFGYMSLHYICRLPGGGQRFELQMRTALQHVWSTIEHDTGYKGDVKIPREYMRQFNRLAGMMELIDDEFSRLRMALTDYRRQILSLVHDGQLDDVPLSRASFRSFLELQPFTRLNKRIAAVNQAEIYPVSMMPYLPVLESFGLETLGDVQRFIDEHSDDAHQLALSQLAITDLDILSSSTALQYLCLVYVMKSGGGRDGLKSIYDTINGKSDSNGMLADMMLEQAMTLPFISEKVKK